MKPINATNSRQGTRSVHLNILLKRVLLFLLTEINARVDINVPGPCQRRRYVYRLVNMRHQIRPEGPTRTGDILREHIQERHG